MRTDPPEFTWITPKWPLPSHDGARIATTQLIRSLSRLGARIHLRSIVSHDEVVDPEMARRELGVQTAEWIRRPATSTFYKAKAWFRNPLAPITIAPYRTSSVREEVRKWLHGHTKTPRVFDGLHAAAPWIGGSASKFPFPFAIYRAHNVESRLWRAASLARREPITRAFLAGQAHRVASFEARVVRASRLVFSVSETDAKVFRALHPEARVEALPIGVDISSCARENSHVPGELLFVGKLDWPPNREGLRWFLERVWPKIIGRSPIHRLTIIGSGNGDWLRRFEGLQGIRVLGQVTDLSDHYLRATASIVPIFFGSGTRVKAIESALYRCPCVSTAVGVEGTGLVAGRSYFQAQTESQWVETVLSITLGSARAVSEEAHAWTCKTYDAGRVAEQFLESFAFARSQIAKS